MEAVGAASAIVGLAVPVFQCAKALRDKIKQVASEKSELSAVLVEYEKDINLLESLYNEHKALLDQHHLDVDLKELAGAVRDLDEWLNSVQPDLSNEKKRPTVKELWRAGDLREKMVATNATISSIRNRWHTRLQVCTLAQLDSGQGETRAMLQRVIYMLQRDPVRQRARTLSMHLQVEPAGFNSQTTRVVANTNAAVVAFSILSPDASLSYDCIKLRLDEYRTLLASDSDTIKLPTENGKTVLCRKQANGMEEFLDQAEALLQAIIQSHDVSPLVALHRLCDLAGILDNLKLYDECGLTGDCALDFAEALGRRSLEFRNEQAETLALIAGLSVYQHRACTLFTQAVSICEEVVRNDASNSNKMRHLIILDRAGYWAKDYPDLGARWLESAVQLMTEELPPTMVTPHRCGVIYTNYGACLWALNQYPKALEMGHKAVSICRTLAGSDPVKYAFDLARALMNMGISLDDLGRYDDATAAFKEALGLCRAVSARDPVQYDTLLAKGLPCYGVILLKLGKVSEAAEVLKEAVTLYHKLAPTGEEYSQGLSFTLFTYGWSRRSLGQHAVAVPAYRESISLLHTLSATDPNRIYHLKYALHGMANSLHALGKDAEGDAAANEALQMNQKRVLEDCDYSPESRLCFVCQRAIISDSPVPHAVASTLLPALLAPSTHLPAGVPTTATSAHTPPMNAAESSELGLPGVPLNPPGHPHSTLPSFLPSIRVRIHGLTTSSTLPPKATRGTVKVLQPRKRDKILELLRRNRVY